MTVRRFFNQLTFLTLSMAIVLLGPLSVRAQDDAPKQEAKKEGAKEAKKEEAKKGDATDPAPKADPEPKGSAKPLPDDYAGLMEAWESLQKDLEAVTEKYRKAFTSDDRKNIFENEYRPLIARAEALLPKLQAQAIAEYKANPGKDEKQTELLLGLASAAVRQDNYETALEIGTMLRAGKCEDAALHYILGVAAYSTQDFDTALAELKAGEEARVLSPRELNLIDSIPDLKKAWDVEAKIRAAEEKADDLPRVKMVTNRGTIVIELFENEAPQAVGNFVSLVKDKFYDGLTFHRVLGNFMAQGGCPEGTGTGGPGYKIYCECFQENYRHHFRGTLSMAHAGRDTGGSQFFLTFRPTPSLDGRHTVFGRVVEGLEVLTKIQRRNPQARGQADPDKILSAVVVRDRGHEYKPNKVGEGPAPGAPAEENKDAPKKDAPTKDAPKKDAPKKDAPKKDAPKKDAPKKDAPKKDAPTKDAPKE